MAPRPLTLDLAANARLSLEFLGRDFDPAGGDYPFYKTHYDSDPTYHRHCLWDYCENPGRNTYAIMFARQLTGGGAEEAAKKMKGVMERHFDEGDGLNYRPQVDIFRPYPEFPPQDRIPVYHEAEMWDNRSVFMGVMLAALAEGDERLRRRAAEMLEGFKRVAVRQGDEVYLTRKGFPPGFRADPAEPPRPGEHTYGWITPLARYHRLFGSDEALELARGLTNFIVRRGPLNEHGILHQMRMRWPDKEFIVADGCVGCRMHCPYMKMVDLVMVRDALRRGKHEIDVPADVAAGARRALERMIAVPRDRA